MTARPRWLGSIALVLAAIEPGASSAAADQPRPRSLDATLRVMQRILTDEPWDGEPSDDLKRAAAGLWKAGPSAVGPLSVRMQKGSRAEREAAAFALSGFPTHLLRIRGLLVDAVRDGICPAAYTLKPLAESADLAVLHDAYRRGCFSAGEVLATLGSPGMEAILDLLGDPLQGEHRKDQAAQLLAEVPCHTRAHLVPRLLRLAADEKGDEMGRALALQVLREIEVCHPIAREPVRAAALSRSAVVRRSAVGVLAEWRDPQAAVELAKEIVETNGDSWAVLKIGELGASARLAVPSLSRYLERGPWLERMHAATPLGRIGGDEAEDALVRGLGNPSWSASLCAVKGLVVMRARKPSTQAALRTVATGHWLAAVRRAASSAAAFLAASAAERAALPEPAICRGAAADLIPDGPKACSKNGQGLRASQAGVPPLPFRPEDPPTTAMRVPEGWLLGYDRGEFGGKLLFRRTDGVTQTVLERFPVRALHQMNGQPVAVIAADHTTILFKVTVPHAGGPLSAAPWRDVPGYRAASAEDPSGGLLVRTTVGRYLLSPSGEIKEGSCETN
jgi:hypothetical protein